MYVVASLATRADRSPRWSSCTASRSPSRGRYHLFIINFIAVVVVNVNVVALVMVVVFVSFASRDHCGDSGFWLVYESCDSIGISKAIVACHWIDRMGECGFNISQRFIEKWSVGRLTRSYICFNIFLCNIYLFIYFSLFLLQFVHCVQCENIHTPNDHSMHLHLQWVHGIYYSN